MGLSEDRICIFLHSDINNQGYCLFIYPFMDKANFHSFGYLSHCIPSTSPTYHISSYPIILAGQIQMVLELVSQQNTDGMPMALRLGAVANVSKASTICRWTKTPRGGSKVMYFYIMYTNIWSYVWNCCIIWTWLYKQKSDYIWLYHI